jgi:hypothetical protein
LSDFSTVALWALWKNKFICPFPCASANGVTVCHAVTVFYLPVCLLQSCTVACVCVCRLCVSILITDITFCWKAMSVCHYVHILFVFPHYSCQITLHPSLYITPFQSEFSSKASEHYFLFGLTVPQ